MIYNLSPREVSVLLRAGSVSLIEMQPATDDDHPLQPPIEPLLLCRREGNQYCLAAAYWLWYHEMERLYPTLRGKPSRTGQ